MIFSSPIFLFFFLPAVLTVYFVVNRHLRNGALLLFSLVFYAWGGVPMLAVLVGSILINHILAIWIEQAQVKKNDHGSTVALITGLVVNIGGLVFFKYIHFFTETINTLFVTARMSPVVFPDLAFPLGLSFFTFKAISYIIDVYQRRITAQYNPLITALYFANFPQVVAGPISRYRDLAVQLTDRTATLGGFARGIERLIIGLGKKVLIANTIAAVSDQIFAIPMHQMTGSVAWLGAVCYALQIYFDFSGYSDMAIGLGLMFGFTFAENFNYPYISQSVTEFWRRWHISLSTWLRDYLFLPIAYSLSRKLDAVWFLRLGGQHWTYFIATIVTMLLAGFWHGANWNFIVWGAFYGVFLSLEHLRLGKVLKSLWAPSRHLYTSLIIVVGWVIFRTTSLFQALGYLKAMFGFAPGSGIEYFPAMYLSREVLIVLTAGIFGSTPVLSTIERLLRLVFKKGPLSISPMTDRIGSPLKTAFLLIIFFASVMSLAKGTYNPFIYFQF